MRVLLVFIALVGAYIAGMVSMLHLVNKISPAAYCVFFTGSQMAEG